VLVVYGRVTCRDVLGGNQLTDVAAWFTKDPEFAGYGMHPMGGRNKST